MLRQSKSTRHAAMIACVAVTVLTVVGVAAIAGTAAAQGPGLTINDSDVTTDDETTYAQEVDAETRLVSWEYDDDREGFALVFETDDRTPITITEAVQFDTGAGSGRIYQSRLPEGTSEVFVSVPRRAGQAAVTMTTPGSIANNQYSYVSTGQAAVDRPPISWERAQLLVILTGISVAGGTVTILRRRRDDDDKQHRRIF